MNIKTILLGSEELTENQEKFRKIFMYLVSGGITTVINWLSYVIFDKVAPEFALKLYVNQLIAWVLAVLSAYFINRIFVFRSHGSIARELLTFAGARVLSFLVLELALYAWVMVPLCEVIFDCDIKDTMFTLGSFEFTYEYFTKAANSVFVVIANYVMSKLMVFRKSDMVDYSTANSEASAEDAAPEEA